MCLHNCCCTLSLVEEVFSVYSICGDSSTMSYRKYIDLDFLENLNNQSNVNIFVEILISSNVKEFENAENLRSANDMYLVWILWYNLTEIHWPGCSRKWVGSM